MTQTFIILLQSWLREDKAKDKLIASEFVLF